MSKQGRTFPLYSDLLRDGGSADSRMFTIAVILGFTASLWLKTAFPPHIIGNAGADDTLFIRLARQLLLGNWLGPFSSLTLVKGMGYPAFIALCFLIGIPLKIGEAILYLSTATFMAVLVRRITSSAFIGAVLFLALAFNPILWSNDLARIIREGIYISLSTGLLALAVALVFPEIWGRRTQLIVAVATGLVGAWFILTREEGVWLLPALGIVAAFGGIAVLRVERSDRMMHAWRLARQIAIALACTSALVAAVSAMNYINYGRFQTVEVNSAPFRRAYGALARIEPVQWRRYVVFPEDVRGKAYAASPAARELKPFFEGAGGENWRKIGCDQTGTRDCPEILAGWFQWALRDAVTAAGHYRSAKTAAGYYDSLATQINEACDAGRMKCSGERETLAPPFRSQFLIDTINRVPVLAHIYWNDGLHPQHPEFSLLSPGDISDPATELKAVVKMADLVGGAQPTAAEAIETRLASRSRSMAMFSIVLLISKIYAPAMLACIILGITFTVRLIFSKRLSTNLPLMALVLGCQAAAASRVILLCYIDATAIPSMNTLYFSPASALLIVSAVTATLTGIRSVTLPGWRHWQALQLKSSPTPAYTPRG